MSTYPLDPITLRINGVDWAFWQTASITRSMDSLAGAFNISLADKWVNGNEILPIAAGAECELLIGSESVINGYIDKVSNTFSATAHSISISGRDKSADMVDCSAIHKPGQWKNVTALQLASILAQPFGLSVSVQGDVGAPFTSFKLEQGETAFEALNRALKDRELLAMPDGKGGIILAKVGANTSSMALEQGKNILSATSDFDMTDRYSDYIVQGQKPGNDKEWGLKASAIKGESTDSAITRYRPFLVRAENNVDTAAAKQRAAWEKTVRAARSVVVSVTVQGFRQSMPGEAGAPLWAVNALTQIKAPYLRIEQELLIKTVTFNRSAQSGTTTTLDLVDPNSFVPEPKTQSEKATGAGTSTSAATYEKEKDLQTRLAESAAERQQAYKEGT